MSVVSDIRRALAKSLWLMNTPGEATVHAGPSDYAKGNEGDRLGFRVRIHFGPPSPEGEDQLDTLVAPTGIKATLEADRTLGGLVDDLVVARCTGAEIFEIPAPPPDPDPEPWTPGSPQVAPFGPQQVLGAEWLVQVVLP